MEKDKKIILLEFIFNIISDFFYITLIDFVIFLIIELLNPRFVSAFINLNALLTVVIITGIITIVKKK